MKGLLYKDFRDMWKQMKSLLVMVAALLLLPLTGKFDTEMFAVAYSALLVLNLFSYDEKSRWDTLVPMLPYSDWEIVLSRYIVAWSLEGGVSVLSFAVHLLRSETPRVSEALTATAFDLGVGLLLIAFALPIVFNLGMERGRFALFGALMVPILILSAMFYLGDGSGAIERAGFWVGAALCGASAPFSARLYRERDPSDQF